MAHTIKVHRLNDSFGFLDNRFLAEASDENGSIIAIAERKTEREALAALDEELSLVD